MNFSRGRKVFKKYEDSGHNSASDNDLDSLSDLEIRRKAGDAAKPRLLRSDLKPRLLFPSAESRRDKNEVIEEDEEATTDLEEPMSPAHEENQSDREAQNQNWTKPSTPFKQRIQPATPPSSRPMRNSRRSFVEARSEQESSSEMHSPMDVTHDTISPPRQTRHKKASPFDAWQRVKQSSGPSSKSQKREGEPMEEPVLKRTRGGAQAS